MGNKGAFINIKGNDLTPKFTTYEGKTFFFVLKLLYHNVCPYVVRIGYLIKMKMILQFIHSKTFKFFSTKKYFYDFPKSNKRLEK